MHQSDLYAEPQQDGGFRLVERRPDVQPCAPGHLVWAQHYHSLSGRLLCQVCGFVTDKKPSIGER